MKQIVCLVRDGTAEFGIAEGRKVTPLATVTFIPKDITLKEIAAMGDSLVAMTERATSTSSVPEPAARKPKTNAKREPRPFRITVEDIVTVVNRYNGISALDTAVEIWKEQGTGGDTPRWVIEGVRNRITSAAKQDPKPFRYEAVQGVKVKVLLPASWDQPLPL